jgi:hypothetical protein
MTLTFDLSDPDEADQAYRAMRAGELWGALVDMRECLRGCLKYKADKWPEGFRHGFENTVGIFNDYVPDDIGQVMIESDDD